MSAPKPKPPDNPETLQPWDRFDPIPQPDVSEGGESMWALWNAADAEEPARVVEPAPAAPPAAAPVVPRQASSPLAPPRPASSGRSGIEKLVEESRRNKRVCPLPGKWQELYAMLRAAAPADADPLAPPPRTNEWAKSTALAKRLMIRDMIDWAAEYSLVDPMMQYLKALPEDQWLHMGE
jgi:hypothetical protein